MIGSPDLATWLASSIPLVVLFVLVFSGRLRTQTAAFVAVITTLLLATIVFDAGTETLLPALGKGAWLGIWILFVVWPALLLYRLASAVGLDRIGTVIASVLPNRHENLLLLAWVLPAFIQGVAGFGTPIAVAAPLLVAMGWPPHRAVLYPLIGYHWAVTFGSMGSSFYMAALTAHLDSADQRLFAVTAATFLALLCLLAGAAVLLLDGGTQALRDGKSMLVCVGLPMGFTLVGVAAVVPAVATLAAGAAGFVAVAVRAAWFRQRLPVRVPRGAESHDDTTAPAAEVKVRHALELVSPYLYLLIVALPVFLWPVSRQWVQSTVVFAPSFPATTTGAGWTVDAVQRYQPLPLFGHPGSFVLVACILGYATYKATGLWGDANLGTTIGQWGRSLPQASWSILLLAMVATLMADSGMVSALARGIAATTGGAFPPLSPVVGALGSFMTGSTTASNALFASLQVEIASLLDLSSPILLAGQTAGGNVGNAIAPVVVLIGATAVDAKDGVTQILRLSIKPAAGLLVAVALLTTVAALLG